MGLTPAERQKRYKEKLKQNPDEYEDIDYTDIVEILPEPEIKIKRGQKYYEFPVDIDVYEK